MESSTSYTSSIRDKRNCRTSCTSRKRRDISRFIAIWIEWKVVVRFHEMLLLSAKCPRSPGRRGNSVWTKIWEIFWRTNFSSWCTGGIPPKFRERQSKNSSIRKKVLLGIFLGFAFIVGRIWEEDVLIAEIEELEKLDASEIYPWRLNAKEVLIIQKDGEFVFLVADGSAKLPGRDYEFQEPTLRREFTVRRENLSGESHGDREEFELEESEDDAEARKNFWSIQEDFIYRHHIEPRVQLYVLKEESCPYFTEVHWCHNRTLENE